MRSGSYYDIKEIKDIWYRLRGKDYLEKISFMSQLTGLDIERCEELDTQFSLEVSNRIKQITIENKKAIRTSKK